MEFLNPAMLMGAAAASLPVIIHLIQRKRAPEHVFPPAELLEDARQQVSRHIRLRHFLVMLLRALFIILLACAFARPFIRQVRQFSLSDEPTACVVLLDDSLSMRYRRNAGQTMLFEDAKNRAEATLRRLRDFDRSAIVTFSGRNVGPVEPGQGHGSRIKALESLEPAYGVCAADDAIRRARQLLQKLTLDEKKLVVLSDMTRSSWSRNDFALLTAAEADISAPPLLDAGSGTANRFFKDVTTELSEEGIRSRTSIQTVGSFPDPAFTVKLFVQEVLRDQKRLEGANKTRETQLNARVDGRKYTGRLQLSDDPLRPDNLYYLAGRSRSSVRVLLVEGDPHETLYQNETYHINLALTAGDSGITTRVITPVRLGKVAMSGFDCVVLANVRPSDYPSSDRISGYLEKGGSLWFVFGDHSRHHPDTASNLARYVPVVLQNIQEAGDNPPGIRPSGLTHPIFEAFGASWARKFKQATFRQWWLMKPKPEANIMMELSNKQPLFVGWRRSGGRVYATGSSLDREWNDFALQPVFVPFVQRVVRFMAGRLASSEETQLRVGDTYRLQLPGDPDQLYVQPPGDEGTDRVEVIKSADGSAIAYSATDRPGVYTVARDRGGTDVMSRFVVNIPVRASDIRRWDDREIQMRRRISRASEKRAGAGGTGGDGIWRLLLWVGLVTLVAESVAARK